MSSTIRFIENDTGTEVSVETVFAWGPLPMMSIVAYPSGRKYAVTQSVLHKHFSIVTPQEVFIQAYGVDDRPTKRQRGAP